VHDEVHAGGRRLTHPHGELDGLAVEALLEDVGEALPDGGVVAVARQEDQHADVAAVGVAAYEDAELAASARLHDAGRHRGELVDRRVEQLVARVGLERVDQGLAGVAVGVQADPVEHVLGLLAQQRDPPHRLGVGRAGEQAEEAALADDLARGVEHLDADVVEIRGAVHGGPGVGLGQDQQGGLARHLGDLGGQLPGGGGHVGVVAEDAVPAPRHAAEVVAVHVVALEVVLAVAEEGEVVGPEPVQEVDAALDLVGRQRGGRLGAELLHDRADLLAHPLPVLDGLADVTQHALDVLGDRVGVLVVPDPADLDVHPRLAHRPLGRLGGLVVGARHLDQRAGHVTADVELRVDDQVHVALLPGQLHHDRVDQEGHVVGDDLDDRVATCGPAVLGEGGREHVDAGPALRSLLGGAEVRRQGAVQLLRGPVADVVDGDVPVVGMEERTDLVVGWAAGAGAALRESDRLTEQVGLLGVDRQVGRH
jgi:hypothetical protein